MILQIIKLKSDLPEDELLKRAEERAINFKSIPGLLQKYYIKTSNEGEYGGVYLWESEQSLKKYQESELAKSIPSAYAINQTPDIEILDVIFQLRNE
ncbi:YdhR family protein [Aquimarina algiphila]|uniref:YdhR family protein n=1 Tax=Aquimarina algiphila TaxID=2047982 RepID=UPI00232EA935|nr:YdhR family protein [Aquimarina algiphila]